jgi:hypothetical protein
MAWLVYTAQFLRMLEVLVATKMAARQIPRISDSPAMLDLGYPILDLHGGFRDGTSGLSQ